MRGTGQRVPRKPSSRGTSRAQSEVLGYVLIVSIVIISAFLILTFGQSAIYAVEVSTSVDQAENSMVKLDSQTSLVAEGDSPRQRVEFGSTSRGQYNIDERAGWINITVPNAGGGTDQINRTYGALIFESGEASVIYQGGAVFRNRRGGSIVLSQPSIDANDGSLYVPIIRTNGSGGGAGPISVTVTENQSYRVLYPNRSRAPAWENPLPDGENVSITVTGPAFRGWASHFNSSTDAVVVVNKFEERVTARFPTDTGETGGSISGTAGLPLEGGERSFRSVDTASNAYPIEEFELELQKEPNANWSELNYSISSSAGGREFEVHLQDVTCASNDVDISMYYLSPDSNRSEEWTEDDVSIGTCSDDTYTIDLIDSEGLSYMEISATNMYRFQDSIEAHSRGPIPSDTTLNQTMNRYMKALGPNVTVRFSDGRGQIHNSESSIIIEENSRLTASHLIPEEAVWQLRISEAVVEMDVD